MTLDSVTLLYTYISRFSENPHHQQQLYLRPSFIPIFNFSHKWPTFAFTSESGYTLAFWRKIAHSGTHGETGAFRMGVASLPSERSARSQTSPGRVSERCTLPLLGLGRVYSRRTQRAFGTAMRLCASLLRGVAAPPGCVTCLQLGDVAVFSLCAQYFLNVRGGGGITTLGAFHTFRKPCVAGYQNGKLCRFWVLAGGAPEERRKPAGQRCAYACRCPEGVAAPLGCVIFFISDEIVACMTCSRNFFRFSRRSSLCCSCASCVSARSFSVLVFARKTTGDYFSRTPISARSWSRGLGFAIVLDLLF